MSRNDFKKILIISHPIKKNRDGVDSYDYYAALVFLLTKGIQEEFRHSLDVVLKIPNDHKDQIEFIKLAAEDKNVVYIIVSPMDVEKYYIELNKLLAPLVKDEKIVFIDQGFEYIPDKVKANLTEKGICLPAYVQANWLHGGEKAGASAFHYLYEHQITAPNIVIFEGGIGSGPRIEGFKNFLNKKSDEVGTAFYPTFFQHNSKYSKSEAHDFFTKYLSESIKSKNPIDIVFCTNDEMALGVREALIANPEISKAESAYYRKDNKVPKIIGFDGILDLTLLLGSKNEDFIYDTILVGLEEQIKSIIFIIDCQLNKKALTEDQRLHAVDCESFRIKHKLDQL